MRFPVLALLLASYGDNAAQVMPVVIIYVLSFTIIVTAYMAITAAWMRPHAV